MRKEQYGDALDRYFRLGKNLNQRDTIAVRKMIDGYLKLIYPNGDFTKEDLRKALLFSVSSQCGADIAKYSDEEMQIKPFAEVEEDEELGIMIC